MKMVQGGKITARDGVLSILYSCKWSRLHHTAWTHKNMQYDWIRLRGIFKYLNLPECYLGTDTHEAKSRIYASG